MKIALLGGTGDIAEGLVLRWSKAGHEIIVGSRSEEKALTITEEYKEKLASLGIEGQITGMANADAAKAAEVVIISIPPEYAASTIESIKDSFTDQVVVTPVVPMTRHEDKAFIFDPPEHGSSALEIQAALPETARLVSAYHNLPAKELSQVEVDLDYDVVICGDDEEAKQIVTKITEDMPTMRVLDAGPLKLSPMIEAITPLIVNLNVKHKKHFSVKFV